MCTLNVITNQFDVVGGQTSHFNHSYPVYINYRNKVVNREIKFTKPLYLFYITGLDNITL